MEYRWGGGVQVGRWGGTVGEGVQVGNISAFNNKESLWVTSQIHSSCKNRSGLCVCNIQMLNVQLFKSKA